MSTLDKETIKNLTKLCRIDCSEEEQESILTDLKKILNYVEQLQEIEVDHISPCNQVLDDMVNVTREDTVRDLLSRDDFLNNAPSHTGGLVRVPTVIKQS